MNMTSVQTAEYNRKLAEMKLAPTCIELRQRVIESVDVPVLNKNGKKTGKVTTEVKHVTRIFRATDKTLAGTLRVAVLCECTDVAQVKAARVYVENMLNPESATGKALAAKGFTAGATLYVAEGGFIGHMTLAQLREKIATAERVETAIRGWVDDKGRCDFRASTVKGETKLSENGIEFTDIS